MSAKTKMEPIDYRNATFAEVKKRIRGARAAVLAAWQKHGPCTTEELAERSGLSILTLRPRTTELYQLGFVELASSQAGAGIYRARSAGAAEYDFWKRKEAARKSQLELDIT